MRQMQALIDAKPPSKRIFSVTVLDAGEFVIKSLSKFTRLAIRYLELLAFVAYFADRRNNRRRPRSKHFFECPT